MRSLDFIIQTLLLIVAVISGVMAWYFHKAMFLFAFSQCALFCWQTINSVICLMIQSSEADIKRKHLRITIIYLILIFLFAALTNQVELPAFFNLNAPYVFTPAWVLVLTHYYITWKLTFVKKKNGNFLPHLGF